MQPGRLDLYFSRLPPIIVINLVGIFNRIVLSNYAKHHALSYAFIKHVGGPERFFQQFPKLDFEAFSYEPAQHVMGTGFEGAISRDIGILEVSS